jgi:hypothetical protein
MSNKRLDTNKNGIAKRGMPMYRRRQSMSIYDISAKISADISDEVMSARRQDMENRQNGQQTANLQMDGKSIALSLSYLFYYSLFPNPYLRNLEPWRSLSSRHQSYLLLRHLLGRDTSLC